MKGTDNLIISAISGVVFFILLNGGVSLPLAPVESPFPAEGRWLLVAHKAGKMSGGLAVGAISEPGLNRRTLDFNQDDQESPWTEALAWARERSNGETYFVFRDGRTAKEGPLTGSVLEMDATLRAAMESAR